MPRTIHLHDLLPTPAHAGQERLELFPGRHLGEVEFDRMQEYQQARLDRLLAGVPQGVVYGLEVQVTTVSGGALAPTFLVKPGLAVGADGQAMLLPSPLRPLWGDLVTGLADGLYLLVLTRQELGDAPIAPGDPQRRTESDPTVDLRIEAVLGTALRRLPDPGLALDQRDLIANRFCLDHADVDLLPTGMAAASLALVALRGGVALWCDRAAGRRLTVTTPGHYALYDQSVLAIRSVLTATPQADGETQAAWSARLVTGLRGRLAGLPAAIQLPPALLTATLAATLTAYEGDPAQATPAAAYAFLGDPGVAVDLVPLRASQVQAVLSGELGRGPLRFGTHGERVRLCLAVNDRDFSADLLDLPQPDVDVLEALYRQYLTANAAWVAWRAAQDALTGDVGADQADDFALTITADDGTQPQIFDAKVGVTAEEKAGLLAARSDPAPPAPPALFQRLIDAALIARGLAPGPDITDAQRAQLQPQLPEPYRGPLPAPYGDLGGWLQVRGLPAPAAAAAPVAPGTGVRRIEIERLIEALEEAVAKDQTDLDGVRDYVLSQRQHLDAHTLNLAALAGGVATDGSGLRLLRTLPFVKLDMPAAIAPKLARPGAAPRLARVDVVESTGGTIGRVLGPQVNVVARADQIAIQKSVLADGALSNVLGQKVTDGELVIPVVAQAVTDSQFQAKTGDFGVISHVEPGIYAVGEALGSLGSLRDAAQKVGALKDLAFPVFHDPAGDVPNPTADQVQPLRYQQLVEAGKYLIGIIAQTEARRLFLERSLRAKVDELARRRGELAQLQADESGLVAERVRADDALREALDDYAMAQRMADEDWTTVAARDDRRRALILSPVALLAVRARQEPIASDVADPLPLRLAVRGDVAPGCGLVDGPVAQRFDLDRVMRALPATGTFDAATARRLLARELVAVRGIAAAAAARATAPADAHAAPAELAPFLDALFELPAADLVALRPLLPRLPERSSLAVLIAGRTPRLQARLAATAPPSTHLAALAALSQGTLRGLLAAAPAIALGSERLARQSAGAVLGIADLLAGPAGPLRDAAERLRGNLERAAGCLVAQLGGVSAGVRLAWGELAADDQLACDQPERWPLLATLEAKAFNTARTLVEIVQWWFRQVDGASSDPTRTAFRTLVRAAVLQAAHGDSAQLLQGPVQQPATLRPGAILRLDLNRTATLGTQLQLFDPANRLVGLLRVDDHDDRGAVASVVASYLPAVSVTTAFRASGRNGG
jgi:hypothetical protein